MIHNMPKETPDWDQWKYSTHGCINKARELLNHCMTDEEISFMSKVLFFASRNVELDKIDRVKAGIP